VSSDILQFGQIQNSGTFVQQSAKLISNELLQN